jgi:tetratricopeptide (TPR) repeat protein
VLTDEEWNAELAGAIGLRRREPDAAIARLRRLARRSSSAARRSVGELHAAEALVVSGTILSETGRHREAASEFQKAARLHEARLRHSGHAAGSALAFAALELFQAGRSEAAARVAWRALRLFGDFPDPSTVHEELIRSLRSHLETKTRRGRPRKRAR